MLSENPSRSRWGTYALLCLLVLLIAPIAWWLVGMAEIASGNFGGLIAVDFLILCCIPLFLILGIVFGITGIHRDANTSRAKTALILHSVVFALLVIGFVVSMSYTINAEFRAIREINGNVSSQDGD